MIKKLQENLWRQFGAGIDMLEAVISVCPHTYFETNKRFYYLAFHTVVLLDYYLTIPPDEFNPVLPFSIKEKHERPSESVGDMVPDKIYTKQELLDYVALTRGKCQKLVASLTDTTISVTRFTEGSDENDMDYSIIEILLYNMRHTQHHVGQLNLMLRQDLDHHMEWVFRIEK